MDFSDIETNALIESIRDHLAREPQRDADGREHYLVEVGAAIHSYREAAAGQPDPGAEVPEPSPGVDRHSDREIEALIRHAGALGELLEGLSDHARTRIAGSPTLNVESLAELVSLSRRAEASLSSLEPQRPARPASPEIALLVTLSIVWTRHTDQPIQRDRAAGSPWARFVEVACSLAGIDNDSVHTLRIRAYDLESLSESAEILSTIPDL